MSKITEGEEIEPYTPYDFGPPQTWGRQTMRQYRYTNYAGPYPWIMYAEGADELAAFMSAMKHLKRLKARADKRRAKKRDQLA